MTRIGRSHGLTSSLGRLWSGQVLSTAGPCLYQGPTRSGSPGGHAWGPAWRRHASTSAQPGLSRAGPRGSVPGAASWSATTSAAGRVAASPCPSAVEARRACLPCGRRPVSACPELRDTWDMTPARAPAVAEWPWDSLPGRHRIPALREEHVSEVPGWMREQLQVEGWVVVESIETFDVHLGQRYANRAHALQKAVAGDALLSSRGKAATSADLEQFVIGRLVRRASRRPRRRRCFSTGSTRSSHTRPSRRRRSPRPRPHRRARRTRGPAPNARRRGPPRRV